MDLLSGLPKEVANNLMEHSKGIIETDEPCEKHPRYNKLLFPNGNLLCPVCYREIRDSLVTGEKSNEYFADTVEGRRKYLYKQSVVSNKAVLDRGFKTFFAKTEKEKRLLEQAKLLIEPIASGEAWTIYLQGRPGSGKSHLAISIAKNANALANGKRVLFMNFPTLQQRIRASYNQPNSSDSEGKFIDQMIRADILVLDDIASEINPMEITGRVTDFSARILYAVMDARAENKPTIITSNIPWADLKELLDPRVYSRMSYKNKVISFEGVNDKRKRT
ncbi:ATP-binding protein [Enterococcus sp. CSURQ0835]|uniref:ATP-binding protein n=1 Tax=Enterococcus sp. CSURQ0835 TaxID=2681394 RepID=UPI001359EEDC|nr:ATP-binding protein [Enterococcus sp. CSURQ0835]